MRLLMSIPVPYDVGLYLTRFSHSVTRTQWIDSLQLNITLSILGDCGEVDIPIISKALSNIYVPSFHLILSGTGFYPNKKGGILWAGIEQNSSLITLQQLVNNTLSQEGYEVEVSQYKPHLTLGETLGKPREKELSSFLENGVFLTHKPFLVDSYSLFSCIPHNRGTYFQELIAFSLR